MTCLRRLSCLFALTMLASCAAPGGPGSPAAQVERLEIVSRGPAFDGKVFEDAGAYEKIVAIAHMRIDPRHPANRAIVDLDKAPTAGGWVKYDTDVILLRPRDAARASRVLLLDIPNRGGKLALQMVNEAGAGDTGNGFLMRRGHTLAWIGWQGDIGIAANGEVAGTAFPVARADGQPLTGQSVEEKIFDDIKPTGSIDLAYPAASSGQAGAVLSVRAHATAAPVTLPASAWSYHSPTRIEVARPRGFDAGAIYQFQYEAADPVVMGLGMAALRDVASHLKSGLADGAGQPNPLADIKPDVTLAMGVSQSGRFLRDLIWQGFNADPRGGRVFDGAMPLIAGSRKSFVNRRFGRPERYSTQHLNHWSYGDQFPFSYAVTTDPVSGATDGIFARCQASDSCPKLMHVDSSTEFWQGRASLVVSDGAGKDIALPPGVRTYLMASTQHMTASRATVGNCKWTNNTAQQGPAVRVLLDHLVAWARSGKEPPASRYPRIGDAMLVPPQRDAVGFPDLRALGVTYPEGLNELTLVDYASLPPKPAADKRYQVLVPMADVDGHDIAGIRLPDVEVPLATYAGWNLRRGGFAEGQLCGLNGLSVPLAALPRAGDPRRALSQRYPTRLEYAKAVALAARALRDQGLLLDEDVTRFIERAKVEQRVGQQTP
ncbi:alpha/beta hydrolase domain-containing protein [Massilia sp. DJPM01]|uniref:alpha/beta hydrolase domain-containing protein n=1 Tax=Massilia sp. DJPM01 TaxID=3024404 RepID=UPI00259D821A|nr:alpha/beta hydrolase domain-containing protein [Massilia sp. DJPM01]MDM5179942.1 alpha/beta hydrolase domain-containing protein [Massilia sp. DJPM01]